MNNYKTIAAALLAGFGLTFAACTNDLFKPEPGPTPTPTPDGTIFDFSMEKLYTLNVQYDVPQGYKVLFEVYTQDPIEIDKNGAQAKKLLSPIDVGYTDENGKYSFPVRVPSGVNKLYIYTSYAGVPRVMVCNIENGVLTDAAEPTQEKKGVGTKSASLRVTRDKVLIPNVTMKTLGTWEYSGSNAITFPDNSYDIPYGRPNYLAYTYGQGAVEASATIWKTINTALPGDNNGPVDERVLQSGDIKVTKEAELSLYFLDQQCLYANALAYYCYDTNNPPANASDIKIQTLAFPNTTLKGTGLTGKALLKGEGIKLKYCDVQGTLHDKFPAGVSIGWVLYSDGFFNDYSSAKPNGIMIESGEVWSGFGPLYSSPMLNEGKQIYTALFRHGDFVVTTFEDIKKSSASDARDYKDLIFHVAANPSDAITDKIPDVDPNPVDPTPATPASWNGTLAFEDLWPRQGDFDMNDVVVKYTSTAKYSAAGQMTEIEEIDITYQLLWSGATIHNGFAVQFPKNAVVTVDGTVVNLNEDRSVVLFEDVLNLVQGKPEVKVNVKFNSPVSKNDVNSLAPFNPYIFSGTKEVHLTGYAPTSKMENKWFNTADDKSNLSTGEYYITFTEDGLQLPFAINIPYNGEIEYAICPEGKRIDTVYSAFINWISSKGMKDADWYLNPKK